MFTYLHSSWCYTCEEGVQFERLLNDSYVVRTRGQAGLAGR